MVTSSPDTSSFSRPVANTISFQGTSARLLPEPTHHYIDWTKVKTLEELLVALNALDITVASNCSAYPKVKHLLRDV